MAADFYQDFVYCKTATSVTSGATAVVVDDVSQFPNNTILAKTNFYVTFESALTYPPTFEIVQVTATNSGTGTLTVVRGQGGTTGVAHAGAVYIKASLTSDMLRRARGGFTGTSVPTVDTDLYVIGDRFYRTSTKATYVFSGTSWDQLSAARGTGAVTSSSLATNASQKTTVTLSPGFALYKLVTDRPARVRLFATTTDQDNDDARIWYTPGAFIPGLLLEYKTKTGALTGDLSPFVIGGSLAGSPVATIPITIQNLDTTTGTVTVTLTYLPLEN